jgi:hypothetical protein
MAMFKVIYEVRQGSFQHTNVCLVSANSASDAKASIERTEAGFTQLWHIECEQVELGEVWLVSQTRTN